MFASPVILFAALASLGGGGPTAPVLSTTTPKAGTLIYASSGNVPGATSYSMQWLRDGVTIAGATSAFYEVAEADIGTALSVRSTPDAGAPVTSLAYAVIRAPLSDYPHVNTNWQGYNTATHRYDLGLHPSARVVLVDGTSTAASGQIYHATSFATATALCRAVAGDWILLPAGQTISALLGEHQVGGSGISGLSGAHPAVIGSFDPADPTNPSKWCRGPSAKVNTTGLGRGASVLNLNRATTGQKKAWVAISNIEFIAGPNDEGQVTGTLAKINGLLLDGCVLDGVSLNIQNGLSTTMSAANDTDAAMIGDGSTVVYVINMKGRSDVTDPYRFFRRTIASATDVLLIKGTDYTVTMGSVASGEYQSCTVTLATANASTHRLICCVTMENQADETLSLDVVVNRSALMYGNSTEGGRSGCSFFFGVRRLHIQSGLVHHGGFSRGHTRTTPNWGHAKNMTSGDGQVAFNFTNARAKLANWSNPWIIRSGATTLVEGTDYTRVDGAVVDDVVQGVTITMTTGRSTGEIIWAYPRTNGPDIYKHGLYVADYIENGVLWNTIVSHDASNSKLTGEIDVYRCTEIRSPMAFLRASYGNYKWPWPDGHPFICEDFLQVEGANVTDAFSDNPMQGRGWLPKAYGCTAGSRFRRILGLRVTGGQTEGIGGNANGMGIASVVNVEDSVFAQCGDPNTSVETLTTKTYTNNVFETVSFGTNIARAALPAGARKAALDEALARNMHTTFVAAMGLPAPAGATDTEKEDNLLSAIGYAIKDRLWNDLVRMHFNADIVTAA